QAIAVATQIRDPNVVSPQDQDVGLTVRHRDLRDGCQVNLVSRCRVLPRHPSLPISRSPSARGEFTTEMIAVSLIQEGRYFRTEAFPLDAEGDARMVFEQLVRTASSRG